MKGVGGPRNSGNPQSGRESVFVVEVDSIEEPGVSPSESAIPQSRLPRLLLRVFLLSSSAALAEPILSISFVATGREREGESLSAAVSQGENPSVLLTA